MAQFQVFFNEVYDDADKLVPHDGVARYVDDTSQAARAAWAAGAISYRVVDERGKTLVFARRSL